MFWCAPIWMFPINPGFAAEDLQVQGNQSGDKNPKNWEVQEIREHTVDENLKDFFTFFTKLVKKQHRKPQKKVWTEAEDLALQELHNQGLSWNEIAKKLEIGNPDNCRRRLDRLEKLKRKWPIEFD